VRRCYVEGGITAAHCPHSTNFSNGPCLKIRGYDSDIGTRYVVIRGGQKKKKKS
jgi:hypothetical protein